MDPLTHMVIGLAVAKATGNPVEVNNPIVMCIAAGSIIPDIDILLQKWGDLIYLKNHRGATHSLLGIVASSLVIASAASLLYHTGFLAMLFWAMAGSASHLFFDMFNAYGAKFLWPFTDRKYSVGMLITFDPVIVALLAAFTFTAGFMGNLFLLAFLLYFISRAVARLLVLKELRRKYGDKYANIDILPSMKGLMKWQFILENKECFVVGEKSILRNRIKVEERLCKMRDAGFENVMYSAVGQFFSEFTPHYHVTCEKNEGIKRYVFTDMRYYLKSNFLHHAVLEMDDNNEIVRQTFNPYSMKRVCLIS